MPLLSFRRGAAVASYTEHALDLLVRDVLFSVALSRGYIFLHELLHLLRVQPGRAVRVVLLEQLLDLGHLLRVAATAKHRQPPGVSVATYTGCSCAEVTPGRAGSQPLTFLFCLFLSTRALSAPVLTGGPLFLLAALRAAARPATAIAARLSADGTDNQIRRAPPRLRRGRTRPRKTSHATAPAQNDGFFLASPIHALMNLAAPHTALPLCMPLKK